MIAAEPGRNIPAMVTLLLALFVGYMPIQSDPDLWFHLADGRMILQTHQVPDTDPFSFTRQGELWVPHSWLFDALLWPMWNLSPRGSEAIMAGVFAATVMISWSILIRGGTPPMAAMVICSLLALAMGNTRGLRPQVFSLLLGNIVIWHQTSKRRNVETSKEKSKHRNIETSKQRNAEMSRKRAFRVPQFRLFDVSTFRHFLLLPLVFLLWAHVHSACVMGLAVVAVWLAGELIESLSTGSLRARWKELAASAGTFVLSVLAVLVTPHRINHFEYVALTMKLKELRRAAEWQMPKALSLESPDVFIYLLIAAVVIVLARSTRRIGWPQLLVCLALMVLALSGVRHIPLACIAAVPLIGRAIAGSVSACSDSIGSAALDSDSARARPSGRLSARGSLAVYNSGRGLLAGSRVRGLAYGLGLMLLVFAAFWRFPCDVRTRYQREEPMAGAMALMQLERPLRVFTTYNTGSYLLFADPQRLKIFVDSRADVYGDSILAEAFAAMNGRGLDATVARWQCDAAVVDRIDPTAKVLAHSPDWQLLAEDPSAVTYLYRPTFSDRATR